MRILICRYHPICEDLAITFSKLGHEVFLSVKTDINDHYGSWKKILENCKKSYTEFTSIDYKQALIMIAKHQIDLVGVDGVFDGDADIIEICDRTNCPHFSISGYPGVLDEPSDNILSLGWSMPSLQYWNRFPSEAHRKLVEWKEIAQTGKSPGKNICVFYPNFWRFKEKQKTQEISKNPYFVSGIQRYKECNPWNFEVFEAVRNACEIKFQATIKNFEGVSNEVFMDEVSKSWGLLHLKQADQPGISVLEAILQGKQIFTLSSFVLASHNQDLIIDGLTAVVADSVRELIERMSTHNPFDAKRTGDCIRHAYIMTSFERQEEKLERFINRCKK